MLISSTGGSMLWPFMTIYLRQRLDLPLTTVTLLMTVNSAAGLAAAALVGPLVDRFGRKRAMVTGLGLLGATLLTMSLAGSLPAWVLLMACQGAFGPLYRIGADAMIADLVPPDRRAQAYAWQRMATNLGIAIGPSVGGFVTATSYTLAFYIAAAANLTFGLLVLLFARETIPRRGDLMSSPQSPRPAHRGSPGQAARAGKAGYGPVLRDRRFMTFIAITTLATVPASLVMVLLAVYAKEQFGLPENRYGFIMATNAAMVVLFQVLVTHFSRRYPPFRVLAVGALLYALGAGSVALGSTFPAFLVSMVILTLGELLLVPTANAVTASLAPPDMRGRYMGLYGLTWGIAYGLGPVFGGLLSDQIAPAAIWVGGLAVGLAATAGFALLGRALENGRRRGDLPGGSQLPGRCSLCYLQFAQMSSTRLSVSGTTPEPLRFIK